MALDVLTLMRGFGYEQFFVCGHDRGGRVAHRLALDHPQTVRALALLDISPTLTMYERTTMEFARSYYHWFFLDPARAVARDVDRRGTFVLFAHEARRLGLRRLVAVRRARARRVRALLRQTRRRARDVRGLSRRGDDRPRPRPRGRSAAHRLPRARALGRARRRAAALHAARRLASEVRVTRSRAAHCRRATTSPRKRRTCSPPSSKHSLHSERSRVSR